MQAEEKEVAKEGVKHQLLLGCFLSSLRVTRGTWSTRVDIKRRDNSRSRQSWYMFVDNLWLDGHLLLLKDRLVNPLLVVLELLLLVLGLVAGVMVHMIDVLDVPRDLNDLLVLNEDFTGISMIFGTSTIWSTATSRRTLLDLGISRMTLRVTCLTTGRRTAPSWMV